MTAAIDRFLYRATVDTVTDQLDIARADILGMLDDFASVLDQDKFTKADLVEIATFYVNKRDEFAQRVDAAEHYLSDFIEQNRP